MAYFEHPTIDRTDPRSIPGDPGALAGASLLSNPHAHREGVNRGVWDTRHQERAAREALRAQVGKLERELSGLVAHSFPHIPSSDGGGEPFSGPRLLNLAELERLRDRLALRVGEVQGLVADRSALERRSCELLGRMRLEPGRYKFARVPVADLGDGHCGVWEVRPRLGLVGMLAGWWHVKLSSGCP